MRRKKHFRCCHSGKRAKISNLKHSKSFLKEWTERPFSLRDENKTNILKALPHWHEVQKAGFALAFLILVRARLSFANFQTDCDFVVVDVPVNKNGCKFVKEKCSLYTWMSKGDKTGAFLIYRWLWLCEEKVTFRADPKMFVRSGKGFSIFG